MRLLALSGVSFLMGFLIAIPVGASQIEVVKRALAGRPGAAMLSAGGSVLSDTTYGFLALFGLASFLEKPWVLGTFQAVGALALGFLAVHTWRQSVKTETRQASAAWTGAGPSFWTGWVLGFTYPPIMFVWLAGAALLRGWGVLPTGDPWAASVFVLSGALGILGYMAFLTKLLARTHHFYSPGTLKKIHHALAVLLAVLSLAFAYQAAKRLV